MKLALDIGEKMLYIIRMIKKLIRRGEDHGNVKLTEQEVRVIRHSTIASKKLAEIYGVSESEISLIKRQKRWGWLKEV